MKKTFSTIFCIFLFLAIILMNSSCSKSSKTTSVDNLEFRIIPQYTLFGENEKDFAKNIKDKETVITSYPEPNFASGFSIDQPSKNIQEVKFIFNENNHLFLVEYVYIFNMTATVDKIITALKNVYGKPEYQYETVSYDKVEFFPNTRWKNGQEYVSLKRILIKNGQTTVTITHENWPSCDDANVPDKNTY